MDTLTVRLYNVRFGDAILVSVPDRAPAGETTLRHILIDFGNVLSDKSGGGGGADAVFEPAIDDILRVLDGAPLDLYVMTHEHMDHVQGLLYAHERLGKDLAVQYAWLTASAAEDYYQTHEKAREKKLKALADYDAVQRFWLDSAGKEASAEEDLVAFNSLLLNNDPQQTSKCVDFLRHLTPHTSYVSRGYDLTGKHPFQEARFEIWAPEEDTSEYYGAWHPLALGSAPGGAPAQGGAAAPQEKPPLPLAGVDAGAFYNLVALRRQGYADTLLSIDKAANNTSVVFSLEWRGWRLLFPGDAEQRSWKTMQREKALKPVHFLKVAHHSSRTGTPPDELLEEILPLQPGDARPRSAASSTCTGPYDGVPDTLTEERLQQRCQLATIGKAGDGPVLALEFPDDQG